MRIISRIAVAAAFVMAAASTVTAVDVDPALADYSPVQGVSGSIKSVGSDTMNNMMTLWAEGFRKFYPNVQVEIEGKGSSTAPPALIEGISTFGPMSRKMKSKEADAYEAAFGYKPVQLGTSIDMLAVFVNKDNPIKGLNLQQIDAIFSSTRTGGLSEDIAKWGQVGLEGDFTSAPISLYGRNSASGTYGYFKKHALFKGDYKDSVKQQPGSSAVVQAVGTDLYGIGYSGIGYKTPNVRVVPLAKEGTDYVPASVETVESYPLARFLWLSVNYKPGSQLDPLRREFLKYIFSKEGQKAVAKDGYLPVSAAVAKSMLGQVGL